VARQCLINEIVKFGLAHTSNTGFLEALMTDSPRSIEKYKNTPTQRPPSIFEALLEFQDHISAAPRDKVYSIARLLSTRDDLKFIVDYSKNMLDVYIGVS
jgi:hypothetical protein